MPKSDKVKIASRISTTLHTRIRVYCARTGVSLQAFVAEAVAAHLKESLSKPQKRLDGNAAHTVE